MFISISCVFLFLSGTAASTPHLHKSINPSTPTLDHWTLLLLFEAHILFPDFLGKFANGYFIWLLPCKISLKLRYRFDFSKKKEVFICILYSIKECLELSSSNVDVAIITPFYDFVREFTVWKLVCIFV